VATGVAPKPEESSGVEVDLVALAKQKPLFVYFYVDPISDPMDENYKFSRKFELSVLQDQVIEAMNKGFALKKVSLPPDADMKQLKNQARIEIWSPTNVKVRVIGRSDEQLLNRAPFVAALNGSIAKSTKLVKEEIARITKLRLEKEQKEKEAAKETAKSE